MLSGKNLAPGAGGVARDVDGSGPVESALQRCGGQLVGKKCVATKQEERGIATHRLAMKKIKIDDPPSPLLEDRKAFDAQQAELCRMLIRKFNGAAA